MTSLIKDTVVRFAGDHKHADTGEQVAQTQELERMAEHPSPGLFLSPVEPLGKGPARGCRVQNPQPS